MLCLWTGRESRSPLWDKAGPALYPSQTPFSRLRACRGRGRRGLLRRGCRHREGSGGPSQSGVPSGVAVTLGVCVVVPGAGGQRARCAGAVFVTLAGVPQGRRPVAGVRQRSASARSAGCPSPVCVTVGSGSPGGKAIRTILPSGRGHEAASDIRRLCGFATARPPRRTLEPLITPKIRHLLPPAPPERPAPGGTSAKTSCCVGGTGPTHTRVIGPRSMASAAPGVTFY